MAQNTTSSRLDWPLPTENQDPWYEAWLGLVNAQDATAFAARENFGAILMGGGTQSLAPPGGGSPYLRWTWGSTIELPSIMSGFRWEAAASTLDLIDGDIIYFVANRAPSTNTAVTLLAASTVPNLDSTIVVGIRRGDRIYFRNGKVLVDGDSLVLFPTGSTPAVNERYITMATNESTVSSTPGIVGAFSFDASDYTDVKFMMVSQVSDAAAQVECELYNLTDASSETILNTSALVDTKVISATLALPAGEKVYTVRFSITPNTPGVDVALLRFAGLRLE